MRIQVGDVKLFFDTDGVQFAPDGAALRKKPTLLLLHGGPGFDHTSFKPHFGVLTDVAQIVYLDHRGNGRSDAGDASRWTLSQWADDVRSFCDVLEIERPIVYGLSFGGMVAQAYAARHPDHPAKVILDSTGPRMRLDLSYAAFERRGGAQARAIAERFWNSPQNTDAWNDYVATCLPLYTRTPQDAEAARRSIIRREVLDHFFRSGGEGHAFDLRAGLARVTCPVLVLSGEDDPITPPGLVDELLSALPPGKARLARFAGTGHGVYRDRPQEVFALLREFLAT